MGKNYGSGIGGEQPGSYFLELRNHSFGLKYLNSLMRIRDGKIRIWDLGSGMEKSQIRDKHPGSATLFRVIGSQFSLFANFVTPWIYMKQ
jgi:hypothetical protein